MEKDAELYEIGYLLKDSLGDEEVLSFSGELRNKITEKSGLITSEGKPRKQNLAYPIKKETIATFNWLRFTMKPRMIEVLEENLKNNLNILRFSIVKIEKEKALKPSALKKAKRAKVRKPISTSVPAVTVNSDKKEAKEEIKEEEIDKKIEELLGD